MGVFKPPLTIAGDTATVLLPHILDFSALAVKQPGYISGETFFNFDHPEECLVIGRCTTIEFWQKWYQDPRRIELDKNMQEHLGAKPEYSIYGIGLW